MKCLHFCKMLYIKFQIASAYIESTEGISALDYKNNHNISKIPVNMCDPAHLFDSFTHSGPIFRFDTLRKYQKTRGFSIFSGGIETKYWPEIDSVPKNRPDHLFFSRFLRNFSCSFFKFSENHRFTKVTRFPPFINFFVILQLFFLQVRRNCDAGVLLEPNKLGSGLPWRYIIEVVIT